MMRDLATYYDLECRRLRLLLKRHVSWLRTRWTVQQDENYQGAAIPDGWADLLLETGLDADEEARFRERYPENERIENLNATVLPLREQMPTGALARAFELNAFDCDLLILGLAPELDPSIEILFAYALDDSARKHATAQLALGLFTDGVGKRFEAQRRLQEDAPLRRFELVRIEPGPHSGTAFHSRPLKVDDRIREFLFGSDHLDPRLSRLSKAVPDLALPRAHRSCVEDLRN